MQVVMMVVVVVGLMFTCKSEGWSQRGLGEGEKGRRGEREKARRLELWALDQSATGSPSERLSQTDQNSVAAMTAKDCK
jgi:hypothetical protein